jgi:acyl-coenzyme A thioesterase PaaI-like protein
MASSHYNKLHQTVTSLQARPFGNFLLNLVIGLKIPFVRTGRIKILEMTPERVQVSIPNDRPIRNHISQVHAAAMMLLGESASGLVTGLNVSENCLPLLKEMRSKFIKRSTGRLTASAQISSEQRLFFASEKGEITLQVEVRDEVGEVPVLIEATWAWIPKKSPILRPGFDRN